MNNNLSGKVFPNFNRKNRWHGIIDYKTLIFIISYIFILWNLINIFSITMIYKIYVLIVFTIPIGIFTFAYISEESVVDILISIVKYTFSCKKYVYILKKENQIIM